MTSVCVVHHLTDGAGWSEGEEGARHAAVVRRDGVCQDVWECSMEWLNKKLASQCCWWTVVLTAPGNFSEVHKNPTDLHSVSNPQW